MGIPGQEYFAGTHFNPQVTWWHYSKPFIEYLSRIQYLMQASPTQADVLYYYGDHVPNIGRFKEDDPAGALPDYDYDLINEDKLLELQVKNGRLVLPHGVSYRVLVLPNHQVLSLAVLKKIERLVTEGGLVIGEKTKTTASLVEYPNAETERERIVDKIWHNSNSPLGARGVIVGKTAKQVLNEKNILPDCRIVEKPEGHLFDWIHRKLGETDYYFISNQNKVASSAKFAFRITGKQPELWNAVTGEVRPLSNFTQKDGQTTIPLEFAPYGSWIIVFKNQKIVAKNSPNFSKTQTIQTLTGAWNVKFDTRWGGVADVKFDTLISLKNRPEEGIKYYSGTAIYHKNFIYKNTTNPKPETQNPIYLDLGDVQDVGIAKVKLNDKDLGTVWAPPFRVNIASALKNGDNKLEIEVVNSWRNRLVGDRGKPQNERFTKTNITIKPEWELLDAGLLGPVQLIKSY
jgi:hypothetical protein